MSSDRKRPVVPGLKLAPDKAAGGEDVGDQVERLRREHAGLIEELRASRNEFQNLAKSAWQLQERERRRLAVDLHDGVGQTLTALKQSLAQAAANAPVALREDLSRCLDLASQALADTREMTKLLRPQVLDDLGLQAALGWLARTMDERAPMQVRFEHDELGGVDLSCDLETLAFRVVQEALNNAEKYSNAAHVRVIAARVGDRMEIEIVDDGCGFDPAEVAALASRGEGGLGLIGMRDRVRLFNGRLTLDAAPGSGARVLLQVPLEAPDDG